MTWLQPNEVGFIDVTLDPRRFSGDKHVNIYVAIGPEYHSEAVLSVQAEAEHVMN